jgi:DNA-binding XRE family transcriptional regulator
MSPSWDPEQFLKRMRERRYQEVLDHPPECTLAELRRSCHKSQAEVAAALGVGQLAVSRLERRQNLGVGTLRAYVTALGGNLELIVRLPRRAVRIFPG